MQSSALDMPLQMGQSGDKVVMPLESAPVAVRPVHMQQQQCGGGYSDEHKRQMQAQQLGL